MTDANSTDITIRERFAVEAFKALIINNSGSTEFDGLAKLAVTAADSLITSLNVQEVSNEPT